MAAPRRGGLRSPPPPRVASPPNTPISGSSSSCTERSEGSLPRTALHPPHLCTTSVPPRWGRSLHSVWWWHSVALERAVWGSERGTNVALVGCARNEWLSHGWETVGGCCALGAAVLWGHHTLGTLCFGGAAVPGHTARRQGGLGAAGGEWAGRDGLLRPGLAAGGPRCQSAARLSSARGRGAPRSHGPLAATVIARGFGAATSVFLAG